jgi:hypothetical protein
MSGSLQRLKKKISKISDGESGKPVIRASSPHWADLKKKDLSESKKPPSAAIRQLAASELPAGRAGKNRSLHFEPPKKE